MLTASQQLYESGPSSCSFLCPPNLLRQTSSSSPFPTTSLPTNLLRLLHDTNPHLPSTLQHPRGSRILPPCNLPPILRTISSPPYNCRNRPPRHTKHFLRSGLNKHGIPLRSSSSHNRDNNLHHRIRPLSFPPLGFRNKIPTPHSLRSNLRLLCRQFLYNLVGNDERSPESKQGCEDGDFDGSFRCGKRYWCCFEWPG